MSLHALLISVASMAGCAGAEPAPLQAAPAPPSAEAVVSIDPRAAASSPPPALRAKAQTPVPPVVKLAVPLQPPLDLKSLELRLRETKAIGLFTKLALKNQIDDLLERFRAFYQGRTKTSLVELRRAFDMLVMKTLALLQDADPPLASALGSSRESIWGILSDAAKFAAI